tara:strand:+ start:289 stop:1356 length:1068 start_codon:yes stop_codon:yes gene_type:complete
MKKERITLYGYFGHNNIGDDMMLVEFLNYMRKEKKEIDFFLLTSSFYKTLESHKNVKQIKLSKYNLFRIFIAILESDKVLWLGGSCFYDTGGLKGLKQILRIQLISKLTLTKFSFLGVGIGKIETPQGHYLIKKIMLQSDKIIFRDPESFKVAKKMNPDCEQKFYYGSELAFLNCNKTIPVRNKKLKSIGFTGVYNLDKRLVDFYSSTLLELIKTHGLYIKFLPAHSGTKNDNIFHSKVAKELPKNSYEIVDINGLNQYIQSLKTVDFHIGFRLHSIVLSDIYRIPNVAVNYAPKVRYYVEGFSNQNQRLIELEENFDFKKLTDIYDSYQIKETDFDKIKESAIKGCNKLFDEIH